MSPMSFSDRLTCFLTLLYPSVFISLPLSNRASCFFHKSAHFHHAISLSIDPYLQNAQWSFLAFLVSAVIPVMYLNLYICIQEP